MGDAYALIAGEEKRPPERGDTYIYPKMMMRPRQENKKSYYVDICINFTPLPVKSTGEEVPRASIVLRVQKAYTEAGNHLIYLRT